MIKYCLGYAVKGDLVGGAALPLDRFMRYVEKRDDGCWWWTGWTAGTTGVYGYFRPGTKARDPHYVAHRWLYEQLVAQIPDGLELDHLCRNHLCVNPGHLDPVTPLENRRRTRLPVCRSGIHDLTIAANIRWDEKGRRRGCKRCWLDRLNERNRIKREAERGA
jgi:hypothetical protein